MKGHGTRHRKAHKAMGGKTESTHVEKRDGVVPASESYGNKNVLKEAHEGLKGGGHVGGGPGGKLARKRGGAVHHKGHHEHKEHDGHHEHHAHGGKAHRAHGGKVHEEHHMAKGGHAHHEHHHGHKKRADGGMVGADKHPFSSAH